jgi:hypothetical protein
MVKHPVITPASIRAFQEGKYGHGGRPWMSLHVGQDAISTGMHAILWLPSGGRYANSETIIAQRWLMPPMNADDLIVLAVRGLNAALERRGVISS